MKAGYPVEVKAIQTTEHGICIIDPNTGYVFWPDPTMNIGDTYVIKKGEFYLNIDKR